MNKKMYEINCHYDKEVFSHYSVSSITVTRRSILEDCTRESISAIDAEGRRFQGNPEEYFNSEEEAWAEIKKSLKLIIIELEWQMTKLQKEVDRMSTYLSSLD